MPQPHHTAQPLVSGQDATGWLNTLPQLCSCLQTGGPHVLWCYHISSLQTSSLPGSPSTIPRVSFTFRNKAAFYRPSMALPALASRSCSEPCALHHCLQRLPTLSSAPAPLKCPSPSPALVLSYILSLFLSFTPFSLTLLPFLLPLSYLLPSTSPF